MTAAAAHRCANAPSVPADRTTSIRVGMLSAAVSRQAGGLFFAMTGLAKAMHRPPELDVSVYGLWDEATQEDLARWGRVRVETERVQGPRSIGFSAKLGARLDEAGLDILHVHGLWMYPSVVAPRWRSRAGGPYVVSPHGMLDEWALRNSRWKKRIAYRAYEKRHLERAACLHALCEPEFEAIRAYGLSNPVCVIPNGVEAAKPTGSMPLPQWRSALGGNAKVLLYLGRFHPKKGLKNLLLACARLQRTSGGFPSGWHIVIAGWDQEGHRADLERLAAKFNLEKSVSFLGPQFGADKDAAFLTVNGFILPSFSEGLPMTVLEAWAYGLPVIMTRHCNLDQGFRAGAALSVDPDPDSIAEGLRSFFAMTNEGRCEMGRAGRDLVDTHFHWAAVGSQMARVYRWLVGSGPRPDCVRLFAGPEA